MKPDVEKLLADVNPHGPSSALREKVLDAVGAELAADKIPAKLLRVSRAARWERRIGWASVAGLLLAIGLNVLAYHDGEARLAPFRRPTPEPQYIADITDTIESATDPATARWFRRQLVAQWRANRPTPENQYEYYQRIREQITIFEKELCHVHTQKNPKSPEMGGDRPGRSGDDTSYYQRRPGLDHQFTS